MTAALVAMSTASPPTATATDAGATRDHLCLPDTPPV
jgi:hypothetical protein